MSLASKTFAINLLKDVQSNQKKSVQSRSLVLSFALRDKQLILSIYFLYYLYYFQNEWGFFVFHAKRKLGHKI